MTNATSTIGTIPGMTLYQPGGLPLGGDERFEIVSTGSATTAASYQMKLTDIGKIPSVMSVAQPTANDLVAFYNTSDGLPYGSLVGNLGIAAGNIPAGGSTGQLLYKVSGTAYSANWTGVASFVSAGTSLFTSGNATALTIGVATAGIGNTQLRTAAALSVIGNYSTAAGSVADITAAGAGLILQSSATGLYFGAVASTVLSTGVIGSTEIKTSGVVRTNLTAFVIASGQIDTAGVSGANIANFAIGSTQINTSGISAANIAAGAIGSVAIATSGVVFTNLTTVPSVGAALGGWGTTVVSGTTKPVLGSATLTGTLGLAGFSAGVVTIAPGAGTFASYNFNLPTTAGSSAQALIAGVNATSPTTWTGVVTLLGTGQLFSGGVTVTAYMLGTVISGTTITIDYGLGPIQRMVNGGTGTLVASSRDGGCELFVKNGAAAGAITFSGFSVPVVTGDTYTTASGSSFFLSMRTASAVSTYRWLATG